jgi:hypothetical protein
MSVTEQFNNRAEFLYEQILLNSNRDFSGQITRFDPRPTEDNDWLINRDANTIEGQFIDETQLVPIVYNYRLAKNNFNNWEGTIDVT